MNFLAHAYLSFNQPEILAGNMMGDFVKGNRKNLFPENIKKGIELHWFIDSFTDTHPIAIEARQVFKPIAHLYAGLFVDIAFDYFLANDAKEKTEDEWKIFAQNTYRTIEEYRVYFPEKFAMMFPYMKQHDWLYNYRFQKIIRNGFSNVAKRAQYLSIDAAPVFAAFEENIPFLQSCYDRFFPELKSAVKNKL